MKKFSLSEQIFFVHVRLLKAVFLQLLLVMRFDYDIVLVLGCFDRNRRFQVVNLSLMLIWRFLDEI